jgi:hypothetical protein
MRSVYLVGILLCVALVQAEFRGGFVNWRTTGSKKVVINVYTAWTTSSRGSVGVDLGDGVIVPGATGAEVTVWTGQDHAGKSN